jgi:hypothetical protein
MQPPAIRHQRQIVLMCLPKPNPRINANPFSLNARRHQRVAPLP